MWEQVKTKREANRSKNMWCCTFAIISFAWRQSWWWELQARFTPNARTSWEHRSSWSCGSRLARTKSATWLHDAESPRAIAVLRAFVLQKRLGSVMQHAQSASQSGLGASRFTMKSITETTLSITLSLLLLYLSEGRPLGWLFVPGKLFFLESVASCLWWGSAAMVWRRLQLRRFDAALVACWLHLLFWEDPHALEIVAFSWALLVLPAARGPADFRQVHPCALNPSGEKCSPLPSQHHRACCRFT